MVIRDLVDSILSCGGRFVHQRNVKQGGVSAAAWVTLEEKQTYDKVGHAFRDMLASIQVKSEVNTLLSPSQPTPSNNDSTQQQSIDCDNDSTGALPVLSFKVSQETDDLNCCHDIDRKSVV